MPRATVREERESHHVPSDIRELIRHNSRLMSEPGIDETRVFIYLVKR